MMQCSHPTRFDYTHPVSDGLGVSPGYTPCGSCIPCILNRRTEWYLRLKREAMYHACSIFLTLTYNDRYVPLTDSGSYTCRLSDVQKFFKKLRKLVSPRKIRYFLTSEYGEYGDRIHYHVILFNFPYVFDESADYISLAWTARNGESLGFVQASPLSDGLIKYTCKYIYPIATAIAPGTTGDCITLMSRNPGIGSDWINSNKDAYRRNPRGFLYDDNKVRLSMPRYYKNKVYDSEMLEQIRDNYADILSRNERKLLSDPNSILHHPERSAYYELRHRRAKPSKLY